MDFNIGAHSAFELLAAHDIERLPGPVILLTGQSEAAIEREAADRGVFDYLPKNKVSVESLDRAIRYSRMRHQDLRKITYVAQRDGLTGLLNRVTFMDRLASRLSHSHAGRDDVYLVYVDIDGFKAINDGFGHQAGDAVLRHVANSMRECVRGSDLVARFGGDEMIAAVFDVARDAIESLARKLLAAVAVPLDIDGTSIGCSVSVGIARVNQSPGDIEEVIRLADCALLATKRQGRNDYRLYSAELEFAARDRALIDQDLRRAIQNDDLHVAYEPQLRVADGELLGFEALARWDHPQRGAIRPSEFVALAEECGTIRELDNWMMMRVTQDIATLGAQGLLHGELHFSLNVSAVQLSGDNYVNALLARLTELQIPERRIQVEVTEQAFVTTLTSAVKQIARLRHAGIKVALDDFGTGHSSLARLMEFSVDVLKLDTTAIARIDTDRRARALVGATIALGQGMDAVVIAEGIERRSQLQVLIELDCPVLQGWLVTKSLNLDGVRAFIGEHPRGQPWRPESNV